MIHNTQLLLYGAIVAIVLVLGLSVGLYLVWQRQSEDLEQRVDEIIANADGEPIELRPPKTSGGPLDYLRMMRHYQRSKKMAKKGYVRWFRLDSTLGRPKWVKPKRKGSGLPKVTVGGQPYYFPREAMVSDELTGAWVAMHREGEADPLNLRDPAYPGIPTDLMERTINMEAESKPPGWLDSFNMDSQTLMWGGIALLFLVYAAIQYANGGF